MDALEWEVYFSDGTSFNSANTRWEDIPDQIIAVKAWLPNNKVLVFGQSHYGRPDTWKEGVDVDDQTFLTVMEFANSQHVKPSER